MLLFVLLFLQVLTCVLRWLAVLAGQCWLVPPCETSHLQLLYAAVWCCLQ
jgi:hypothetical protein